MQNWHAIETETAYRRQEWERTAAADARRPWRTPPPPHHGVGRSRGCPCPACRGTG